MVLSKAQKLVRLCVVGREIVVIHSLHCEEVGEDVGDSQKVMLILPNRLPAVEICDSSAKADNVSSGI